MIRRHIHKPADNSGASRVRVDPFGSALSRNGAESALGIVLPIGGAAAEPLFWRRVREELGELAVRTEIIAAGATFVNLSRKPARAGFMLPSAGLPVALLRSRASDFLCVEYTLATFLSVVIARLKRKRAIVFQEHQGRGGRHLPLRAWERGYRRLVGSFASAFVANTDAAYRELTLVLGIDPRKVFRVAILIPPERAALSRAPGIVPTPFRRPVFLFVGRLVRRKNVGSLLSAAAELVARGHGFELWVIGDGPDSRALEREASHLTATGFVRFLGAWSNAALGLAYDAADIFVMPSLWDYRSVAVLEALRFGVPVIDSAYDGNAGDTVRHEVTGVIFDPYEPGALAAAMERAVCEPARFREMGRRAAAQMEEQTPRGAAVALRGVLEAMRSA
jgi:glycosyltransferase involved in cell wall biosynthesis